MDFDKFFKLIVEYLTDYVSAFVAILQNPALRFRPVPEAAAGGELGISIKPGAPDRGLRLDPRLFSFVLLSIFIGSTLNAMIPGAPARPDFATVAVIILATWFFYSCIIHFLARMLGGPGTFWETMSVSLQVFAVLYVVGSFAAFLWAGLARAPQVRIILLSLHFWPLNALVNQPSFFYYLIQLLLLAIYLPRSMKHVHRLKRVEQLLISMLALVFILIGYTLFPVIGLMLQSGF